MRKLILFVSFISTLGFGYQAMTSQTLTTWLAALASLIVFLTAIANLKANQPKDRVVSQSIGNKSNGVQIGGNVFINDKDKK